MVLQLPASLSPCSSALSVWWGQGCICLVLYWFPSAPYMAGPPFLSSERMHEEVYLQTLYKTYIQDESKKIWYQFFFPLTGIKISLGNVLKPRPFPLLTESESVGMEFCFKNGPPYPQVILIGSQDQELPSYLIVHKGWDWRHLQKGFETLVADRPTTGK